MAYINLPHTPDTSGVYFVIYKNSPSWGGCKLFYDKKSNKFLSKKGRNKTHRILKWEQR